jgi:hypothetical protein
MFEQAIQVIQKEFVPAIRRHSISGHSAIRTENPYRLAYVYVSCA